MSRNFAVVPIVSKLADALPPADVFACSVVPVANQLEMSITQCGFLSCQIGERNRTIFRLGTDLFAHIRKIQKKARPMIGRWAR